jgi:hypothetical protein
MELIPRFHQEFFVKKTIDKIKDNKDNKNKFLWGWKCRAGKTYGIGHLIDKYYNEFNSINAIIITPVPSETLSQFSNEMFKKFTNFRPLDIHEINKGTDLDKIRYTNKNNIIIISKQLLDNYVKSNNKNNFHKQVFDLVIFDENHFGGTTNNSKDILNLFDSNFTNQIFLTATYQKTLNNFSIDEDCQFYWTIEDELYCKNRQINKLKIKHGEDIEYFLNKDNIDSKLIFYDNMPNMHLLSTIFDQTKFNNIKHNIDNEKKGFSMDVLFSIDKKTNNFLFENQVKELLKYIIGVDDNCIYKRIINLSLKHNSRTLLNNENFTTQLWFLPFGIGLKINDLSKNLKNIMMNYDKFKNYEILIINSQVREIKNLKETIHKIECDAIKNNKDGLILLAGNQCSLGITLPLVDIVFLMNNISSSDKIMQMMYRCMSETSDGSKKNGYVVDFNINRVLHTFIDYPIFESNLMSHQKIEYMIENNLIHLDNDIFESKKNNGELINKLLHIWKNDPDNEHRFLFKKIQNLNLDIPKKEQEIINNHFSSLGDDIEEHFIKFDDEINQMLPNGRKRIPITNDEIINDEEYDDTNNTNQEIDIDNKKISLQHDILPLLIPLISLMNHDEENINLKDSIEFINNSEELKDIINQYTFMIWEKDNLFNLIYYLSINYLVNNNEINNILYQFRMTYNSLINEPNELLDYLKKSLKPKELEKKKFGEVFTPMILIDDMMDKLDEYYKKDHKKSIFSNSKLKWYDPASGMGTFPVNVYYRLMDGLKKEIPNDETRKKHILENMLYMAEINKKNCYIISKVLNNKKYKLNIYCGDSLNYDIHKKFNIEKFDVIMGNPPFNKGGIKSSSGRMLGNENKTIWPDFIQSSLNHLQDNGYLTFINPLSWLKKTHKLHTTMCQKEILWMKLFDNTQSKSYINAMIPLSIYILKNTENTNHNKTEIHFEMKNSDVYGCSNYYINPEESIPFAYFNIYEKVINFIKKNKLKLNIETKIIKSDNKKLILPKKYKLEDNYAVDTHTIKEGIIVKKIDKSHPDSDKNKLIIANKSSLNGLFIDDGRLGLTGTNKFYILGDNLTTLKKFLEFKIFKVIVQFTKYNMDFLNKECFEFIPDIRKFNKNITEDEFYELLKLTRIEINNINKL